MIQNGTNPHANFELVIVGAGLVGLSTALKVKQKNPKIRLAVIEAANGSGTEQSSHNSEVLHSGLYYEKGSFKAQLCNSHRDELLDFCLQHGVQHEITGKLVVATEENQIETLTSIYQKGRSSGLDLSWMKEDEIKSTEKRVRGLAAILSPSTGSVDYGKLCRELQSALELLDVTFYFNSQIEEVEESNSKVKLVIRNGCLISAEKVIFAAGGASLKFAKSMGFSAGMSSLSFKGVYRKILSPVSKKHIYPVPDDRFPFLGVHITNHLDGTVTLGPNAAPSTRRWIYSDWHRGDNIITPSEGVNILRFASNYPTTTAKELISSISRSSYLKRARKLVPDLEQSEISDHIHFGIRHQLVDKGGNLVSDFAFHQTDKVLFVLNAPSPAATACFAIGEQLSSMVFSGAKRDYQ